MSGQKSKIVRFFFVEWHLNFRRLIFCCSSFNVLWTISNKNVLQGKNYTTGLDVSIEIYNDLYYNPFDFEFVTQGDKTEEERLFEWIERARHTKTPKITNHEHVTVPGNLYD